MEVRLGRGERAYAYDWRLHLREETVRRSTEKGRVSGDCTIASERR